MAAPALAILFVLQACETSQDGAEERRIVLEEADYEDLPGWLEDDHRAALEPLQRSCRALQQRADEDRLDISGVGGRIGDWRTACVAAEGLANADQETARSFFEYWFKPYAVYDGDEEEGLFTGYFEPELNGASRQSARYNVPLLKRPTDLVMVDLGRFRADLAGDRIAGRIAGGVLVPYPTRAEIDRGALSGQRDELVWVDDAISAFFLHIQGSGRIVFEDGTTRRIAYAGTNGHNYFPIGRRLLDMGVLEREELSMPSIRTWLEHNPDKAQSVMHENKSYVFFRWLDGSSAALGPVGAQGTVLSAERSLAVDRRFLPLGAPFWVVTDAPDPDPEKPDRPVASLMIAQDTGGAIRGPVRGDVFWGTGTEAGAVAGRMKHQGRYWVLLPRDLDVTEYLD